MTTTRTPRDNCAELLRRVELTCKARYYASRRFAAHELWSQWTLALLVVGQICIALILALGLPTRFPSSIVHLSAVAFGVVVLTYSLLLGLGRYGARSIMIHACGLELGRLARRLYDLSARDSTTEKDYEAASTHYYDTLQKYENHGRADYEVASYEYYSRNKLKKIATQSWREFLWEWADKKSDLAISYVKLHFFLVLQFSHYVLSILIVWLWVAYIVDWSTVRAGAH